MRRLALAVLALAPLAALAEPPAEAPRAETQAAAGPRPIAIEAAPPAAPAAPSQDPARHERRGSYLYAKAGVFAPRHADLAGFKDGFAVEVGAGARVWRFLSVEVGTGWLGSSYDEYGSNTTVGSFEVTQHIHAVPLLASVRASGRFHHVEGYVLAGAGAYLWSFDGKVRSSQYAPYTYADTDTSYGLHAGAGVSAHVARRLALGIEGKYLLAQTGFFGRTANADSAIVTANVRWGF